MIIQQLAVKQAYPVAVYGDREIPGYADCSKGITRSCPPRIEAPHRTGYVTEPSCWLHTGRIGGVT